ncbi:MAG: glycoside hydrolase family 2 [Chloroflexi bacterium]|nr:glycoside hydrolase family 2 [Chloroflexota bacterium]MCC6891975.1 glycoside hydrolase family 2 [Anaerolineae bacterium]
MALHSSRPSPRETLLLDGEWSFALDPQDTSSPTDQFDSIIRVPSSWEEQGFGDPPAVQPLGTWSKRHQYEGAAWYSRVIEIPPEWADKTIRLHLKGVRWRSQVWLDTTPVGTQESLSTPHIYDLTPYSRSGQRQRQRLVICIDNRMLYPIKESHINSDHTATRWGGISGGVELEALPLIRFENITCRPNIADRAFEFQFQVNHQTDLTVEVKLTNTETQAVYEAQALTSNGQANVTIQLGDEARLWWDDDPFLYLVECSLRRGHERLDQIRKKVGLREIRVEGRDILLNGQAVFLRGYVDCCIFPQTGYPSWDVDQYRRQFAIAKSYGFNHVRLHSWTPPEPFWIAADEAGMLVQTELPNWTRVYDHDETNPPDDVHQFLSSELERIIPQIQLHPSWVMFSNGNELLGGWDGHHALTEWVERGKQLDPTRIYTDNTGFGQLPAPSRHVDFYIQSCNWHPPKKIYDAASNDTTQDFSAITALSDAPLIGHEHGQFTMYVRPQEAEKYNGVIYPSWLDYVNETLEAKGLAGRIDQFIQASGTHIVRTYKENIERARRTHGLSGFQLLDIRDFPGQGHATTGILDVFWDSKGLIEPDLFAEFNSAVTLLMRSPSPTFWNGKPLEVEIDLSNFGHTTLTAGRLHWELRSAQTTLTGEMTIPEAPAGKLTRLGRLSVALPEDTAAHTWELVVRLGAATNRWHVWSYPYPALIERRAEIATRLHGLRPVLPGAIFSDDFTGIGIFGEAKLPSSQLVVTDRLTGRVLQYLHDGGSVWLMPNAKAIHGAVPTRYLPPFWSYLWFPDNVSNVMGMVIHNHPLLARFPHDGMSDWQWYSLINEAPAICLDATPHIEPIVEVIDNFSRAKRLCYAFEATVGKGRLLTSTWRLTDSAVIGRPEARFLFHETIHYILGDDFNPAQKLSVGELLGMFKLSNGVDLNME